MKMSHANPILFGAALLALGLAGCGSKNEPAPGANTAPAETQASQVPEDVTGASLGTRQKAGPFQVDLRADGSLSKGENAFEAVVTRSGKPVTDATVKVLLTMPAMKMYGSEVLLPHTADGHYQGNGNLSMGGDWQANVTVEAAGEAGDAVYDFRVTSPEAP